MIKGFRIMVGQLPDNWIENVDVLHSKEPFAKAVYYCHYSGRLTMKLIQPMDEKDLPKQFIESAKGIVIGESNLELIYI